MKSKHYGQPEIPYNCDDTHIICIPFTREEDGTVTTGSSYISNADTKDTWNHEEAQAAQHDYWYRGLTFGLFISIVLVAVALIINR